MDPQDQPTPAPADADQPAAPAQPAPQDQPVPAANGEEGAPAQGGAVETPPAEGTPAPSDEGGQPTQSRQERRNAERQSRMQQLNQQMQQGQQPNQLPSQYPNSPGFDVTQYADNEGNLDINATNQAFQQSVVQTADAIATLRVDQQLAHRDAVNNFNRDTETLPTKFPELDPNNSDLYTEDLDAAIAADFQERAFKPVINPQTGQPFMRPDGKPVLQLDTSVRLADIAERHVKAARSLAQKMSTNSNNAVASAADSAAPRPTGAKPTEKAFKDLTLAEMKAKVGYHRV